MYSIPAHLLLLASMSLSVLSRPLSAIIPHEFVCVKKIKPMLPASKVMLFAIQSDPSLFTVLQHRHASFRSEGGGRSNPCTVRIEKDLILKLVAATVHWGSKHNNHHSRFRIVWKTSLSCVDHKQLSMNDPWVSCIHSQKDLSSVLGNACIPPGASLADQCYATKRR